MRSRRYLKVRTTNDNTGAGDVSWIEVDEIAGATAGKAIVRDGARSIFEQESEPAEAQPGDYWIMTEDK